MQGPRSCSDRQILHMLAPVLRMSACFRLAEQRQETQRLRSAELLRLGFVMALAMTLHNMPEGFAVRLTARIC